MYKIDGLLKFSEEDSFEEGCLPDTGQDSYVEMEFTSDTVLGLIKQVMSFLGIENDTDAVQLNACDEVGRVDFSTMENGQGNTPSKLDYEVWKDGRKKLWACIYTGHVVSVELVDLENVTL